MRNKLFFLLADVIVVHRVQHLHSFTESPPNEFRFHDTDSLAPEQEDEDDQSIMEKTHVNIIEEPIQTLPIEEEPTPIPEKMMTSNDKENKVPEQSINMTVSTLTLNPTNDPSLDGNLSIKISLLIYLFHYLGVLEKINRIIKRIFEIKKSDKVKENF